LNHDLLVGKWEAQDKDQFVTAYEFGADKSVRVWIWHVPEPISGTYSWSGNNSLTLECHPSEEAKKAYKEQVAAFRQRIRENASGQYKDSIAKSADKYPDEFPEKEVLRIGLSEKPVMLEVMTPADIKYTFTKAK
jgi:hypothetical protein